MIAPLIYLLIRHILNERHLPISFVNQILVVCTKIVVLVFDVASLILLYVIIYAEKGLRTAVQ